MRYCSAQLCTKTFEVRTTLWKRPVGHRRDPKGQTLYCEDAQGCPSIQSVGPHSVGEPGKSKHREHAYHSLTESIRKSGTDTCYQHLRARAHENGALDIFTHVNLNA